MGTIRIAIVGIGNCASSLQVQGNIANNQLHLELDPGFAYVDTFVLQAEFRPDLSLIGTLSHSSTHIEADFVARPLARGNLQLDLTVSLPATVTALCFDDSTIWASTSGDDYIRLRTDGTIADTVVVLYERRAHWTSSALAFDGNHLWGFLPVTIIDPGGSSRNVSKMLEFTAAGEIVGDFMLSHRTTGLAFDGHRFWSPCLRSRLIARSTRAAISLVSSSPADSESFAPGCESARSPSQRSTTWRADAGIA